ncbi:carboxylesterase [Mycolicibacterium peregrinum]|uniref:Carboxylesterase n=1 Tax=Mycolicibacterium peregrinum TaxID=43304 RepID=A0A1A0QQE2_MYCPR|nr:alpha/beta hydrolase [Mycolicibacterium peregrinum]OBB24138.1 carboxylesterase [Mycolicibacterium peregrinum]
MDLRVPEVNIARRWARKGLGAFVSDAAFEHFLAAYRAGMATLPPFELFDVPTSFGTVRVYRFAGPDSGAPVVLLPGRNASTPMYRANLGPLLEQRAVYAVDLLGEAGLSVQRKVIRGGVDQAQWLDETLAGLELDLAHLLGVSMGGWTAANCAVHRRGRIASLTLLDPVFTFTGIPAKAILASVALFAPGVPERFRRGVHSWIAGGADLETADIESALIDAGAKDFALHTPMPELFSDEELRSLDVPVLALIAGRSVMLDPERAVARAREVLARGEVEIWADASHAINGEYPEEIAQRTARFWDAA